MLQTIVPLHHAWVQGYAATIVPLHHTWVQGYTATIAPFHHAWVEGYTATSLPSTMPGYEATLLHIYKYRTTLTNQEPWSGTPHLQEVPCSLGVQGWIQRLKKGWGEGGHTYRVVVGVVCSCLCTYSTQCCSGVWRHAPSGKFRPYESTSETIGDHPNHATFMASAWS